MGLRIGDSAANLHALQGPGAPQRRETVRPRATAPAPEPRNRLTQGLIAPVDHEQALRNALREPVASAPAAAVRALGANLRAIRAHQPSLEEQRQQLRERFEQAREQIFGPSEARAIARAERQEAIEEARDDTAQRTRIESTTLDRERTPPNQTTEPRPEPAQAAGAAPPPPSPRELARFEAPTPPGSFDIRG